MIACDIELEGQSRVNPEVVKQNTLDNVETCRMCEVHSHTEFMLVFTVLNHL